MIYAAAAVFCAVTLWILSRAKAADRASAAPALVLAAGAGLSLVWRAGGAPFLPSDWVAAGADTLLAALAFVAAAQFRISKLAASCPASMRLTLGGAPLFLIVCSLAAFMLAPQLTFSSALLLGGALMLNGAAFDRRAVTNAPAPALIKAAVRLESAAILALGIPVVVILEGAATAAPAGLPAITPVYEASRAALIGFGFGGVCGLAAAGLGKRWRLNGSNANAYVAAAGAMIAFCLAALLGGHPVVAAAAAGLIWGEQTKSLTITRVRLRRAVEKAVAPAAYFGFGVILAPRFFQGDLLVIIFALAAVTILRVVPRLIALKATTLPKESQAFLAWFGGAPGAASALFLISLFDATALTAQDAILTIGALAVAFGVFAARLTAQPLIKTLLKETALAKKRALFAG